MYRDPWSGPWWTVAPGASFWPEVSSEFFFLGGWRELGMEHRALCAAELQPLSSETCPLSSELLYWLLHAICLDWVLLLQRKVKPWVFLSLSPFSFLVMPSNPPTCLPWSTAHTGGQLQRHETVPHSVVKSATQSFEVSGRHTADCDFCCVV
jgi:hypothetical protein